MVVIVRESPQNSTLNSGLGIIGSFAHMYDHPKLSSSFFRRVQVEGKVVRSSQVVSVFVMVKIGPKGAFFDPKGYQKKSDFLR